MIWFWIVWIIAGFFAVRVTVFEFMKDNGNIEPSTWVLAILYGVMGVMGYLLALAQAMDGNVRKAHFLSEYPKPKPEKIKKQRYPYVRHALGKVFMIGDSK